MQKSLGELKPEGELIFSQPPDTGFQLDLLVNEALSFHNKCKNHSCVWDFGNLTVLLKQWFSNFLEVSRLY